MKSRLYLGAFVRVLLALAAGGWALAGVRWTLTGFRRPRPKRAVGRAVAPRPAPRPRPAL